MHLDRFECSQSYSDNITIGYAWFLSPGAEITQLRLLTMMLKIEVRVTDYIAGILSARLFKCIVYLSSTLSALERHRRNNTRLQLHL